MRWRWAYQVAGKLGLQGGPVRMDHEGQHADQGEAEDAERPPENRARDHGFSIARRAVSALPSQG